MRAPVYRNLDRPFQIFGFSPFELTFLCVIFVGIGEASQSFGYSRIWSFLVTTLFALGFYWIRFTMGDYFGRRVIRFAALPDRLQRKLIRTAGLEK